MRLNKIDSKDVQALSAYLESREAGVDQQMNAKVLDIIEQVRTRKDDALLEYTEKFDHVKLDSLIMSEEEIEAVMSKVDASLIADLKEAAENIACYHEKQLQEGYEIQKEDGVYLGQRVIPLERVGVYVPGGRAAYPSTVLMNVIPAKIAGVKEIVMVIGAANLLTKDTVVKANWAGKLASVIYFVVFTVIMVFPGISANVKQALCATFVAFSILAFVLYGIDFIHMLKKKK